VSPVHSREDVVELHLRSKDAGAKLFFAILIGILLAIPLFATWFIIYDRESQSQTATTSITQGWGGPQRIAGPTLIIPYTAEVEQTFTEGDKEVVRKVREERELTVKAAALAISTDVKAERRSKSIHEVNILAVSSCLNSGRLTMMVSKRRIGSEIWL